ncbi:3-isopropylmalate dehydrogenase [Rhizodiscina lignyota]|uniref:3-isopropylmalate dehydrogenase n=1 Tax=Rhizodiscina lignyota TaxID=1504668 RepID=A0A9P4IB17_9PEZI|nr:3-isopropylmalate dehydrogenase [Rhizodiscina lignyota]
MSKKVLVLPGDHVGPEVMEQALRVLDVVQEATGTKFELKHDLCGGCSIDKHGKSVTDEVVKLSTDWADAIFFGSAGGPEWGHSWPNPELGLLTLRKATAAFANLRPCTFVSKSLTHLSPLKTEIVEGVDFMLVRENCGGAYFGPKLEDNDSAQDTWLYTRPEVERCAHIAAALALQHDPPLQVTSSDKANVLASGRLWRRVVSEVFEKHYPQLTLKHQLADSLAMIMIKNPRAFNGVIVTDNTFGDLLSDEAGGLTGTLGVLPSASLCDIPAKDKPVKGIYEPIHGSAPDISGKGIVNPAAQILSLAMMLRFSFVMYKEADAIEAAVAKVIDDKSKGGLEIRTGDIGGKAGTKEMGDAICSVLKEMLGGSSNGAAH